MAIYGGQPPSDYYARQDARKDDKFRDIINLFLQIKQANERGEEFGQTQDLAERKFAQQKAEWPTQKGYMESIEEKNLRGPDPTPLDRDIQKWISEGVVKDYKEGLEFKRRLNMQSPEEAAERGYESEAGRRRAAIDYPVPATPSAPSDRDKLKAELDARVASKTMMPERRDEILYGPPGGAAGQTDYSGPRGDPSREANQRAYINQRTALADIDSEIYPSKQKDRPEAFRQFREKYNQLPALNGVRLDMPHHYQMAIINDRDGVATPYEIDTIEQYDALWEFFVDLVTPPTNEDGTPVLDKDGIPIPAAAPTWKKFTKHEDYMKPGIDRKHMMLWYQSYGTK